MIIVFSGKRRVFDQHQKHQNQHANQQFHSGINRKGRLTSTKSFQKQSHPEYHFDGAECTVGRNPADGRKRVHCNGYEERDIMIVKTDPNFTTADSWLVTDSHYIRLREMNGII